MHKYLSVRAVKEGSGRRRPGKTETDEGAMSVEHEAETEAAEDNDDDDDDIDELSDTEVDAALRRSSKAQAWRLAAAGSGRG